MTLTNSITDLMFIKESIGQDRKPIKVFKLRTMIPDADKHLEQVVAGGFDNHGNPINDNRITPTGKILRKYWIDELPQLYNIVKGDLAPVGIRPMREKDWARYPDDLVEEALNYKPGFLGVPYAFPNDGDFDQHIEHLKGYLAEKKKHPILTDVKYGLKILGGIIFKGIRSR